MQEFNQALFLRVIVQLCHVEKSGVVTGIELGRVPERTWIYPNSTTYDKAGVWVSSDAGACLSCHQKYLTDAAKSHIETNGGILNGSSTADITNSCIKLCNLPHASANHGVAR